MYKNKYVKYINKIMKGGDNLTKLPIEILFEITQYLKCNDLKSLEQTNKKLYTILQDIHNLNYVYKQMKFPHYYPQNLSTYKEFVMLCEINTFTEEKQKELLVQLFGKITDWKCIYDISEQLGTDNNKNIDMVTLLHNKQISDNEIMKIMSIESTHYEQIINYILDIIGIGIKTSIGAIAKLIGTTKRKNINLIKQLYDDNIPPSTIYTLLTAPDDIFEQSIDNILKIIQTKTITDIHYIVPIAGYIGTTANKTIEQVVYLYNKGIDNNNIQWIMMLPPDKYNELYDTILQVIEIGITDHIIEIAEQLRILNKNIIEKIKLLHNNKSNYEILTFLKNINI